MEHIFFNGWRGLLRTFVIGIVAYVMLIVFLQAAGKRTLTSQNGLRVGAANGRTRS